MDRVHRVNLVRIYTANFVADFIERMRNIIGGRQKRYEVLMQDGIEEVKKEFYEKYPGAIIVRIDLDQFTEGAIIVHVEGDVPC